MAKKKFNNCYCDTIASHWFYLKNWGEASFFQPLINMDTKIGKQRDAPSGCTKEILLRRHPPLLLIHLLYLYAHCTVFQVFDIRTYICLSFIVYFLFIVCTCRFCLHPALKSNCPSRRKKHLCYKDTWLQPFQTPTHTYLC